MTPSSGAATAKCNHENIVVIHDADEYQGAPYMVLEFLEGSPLSRLLRKGRKLPQNRAVSIMISVVRALECAHSHNIVHRDLKPDNIFITDNGTVKVLDFGIAKLLQGEDEPPLEGAQPSIVSAAERLSRAPDDARPDARHDARPDDRHDGRNDDPATPDVTRQGAIIGTLPYMSPEQWGADTVDHRTDLWAVGILLFRMLAGRHPLHSLHGIQLMVTGVLSEPMPRALDACEGVSEEVAAIIDRCLVKPKAGRWGAAGELLDALEQISVHHGARRVRAGGLPFAGLRSFQENDAARFFGRDREITAAVTRLQSQPLLGVVGPSGVGKSSFVRAGLVPALKQSGEPWSAIVLRPGRNPVGALALAVAPAGLEPGRQTTAETLATVTGDISEHQVVQERLYAEPGYLGVILRSRAQRKGQRILLFVDQFEELHTLVADPRERLAFTRCLASAADDPTSPLRVVLSVRSDFLDRVSEDEQFMSELSQGLFFLAPPSRSGLRDALTLPVQMADFQYETLEMVEHMLDHLEHVPSALPLLQFAAAKLWEMRDEHDRLLTMESYQSIGGITGALASHADAVLTELPSARQQMAQALFLRLVTPERTRAVVPQGELHELAQNRARSTDSSGDDSGGGGEIGALIDHLVRARLLVVQTGSSASSGNSASEGSSASEASVEIVHESLLHAWPRLRRWLDENQDDASFLEQLRNAARQWHAKHHAPGLLWRGEAAEDARRWFSRYRGELTQLERAYLDAVFTLSFKAARRKRIALVAVIACLSLLVTAAAVALVMIRDAQQEAEAQAAETERQLQRARRAEEEANAARQRAEEAREAAVAANQALVGKDEELAAAARAAIEAQREAEEARKRAEQSRRRARSASESLATKRQAEKEHTKELEKQGVISIIPDVEME